MFHNKLPPIIKILKVLFSNNIINNIFHMSRYPPPQKTLNDKESQQEIIDMF